MKKQALLMLFLTFMVALTVVGQITQSASVVHNIHKIDSQILGEQRTILVRVPANYQRSTERFPVVYMLDAHPPQNAMMAGIVEQQAWGGVMPEMIVVGIQNTDRTRDLTPSKEEGARSGGGAEKFLDFIEKEVIPLVEQNYRVQPFRIIAGHSYGGLFAIHAMVTRPRLFDAYIAASPTLHYDNDLMLKRADEAFKQNKDLNKTLFASIGDEPEYVRGFERFQALLKKAKKLDYETQIYKDENHGSTVLRSYLDGFRKIFKGWAPAPGILITDLETHYEKLSKRFGFKIAVPEETQNLAGYTMLREKRLDEAIRLFKKNTENYPDSANTYDSLAEAYEKHGELKLSAENYEKAYKMAEKQGDTELAKTSRANFERVSAKIK